MSVTTVSPVEVLHVLGGNALDDVTDRIGLGMKKDMEVVGHKGIRIIVAGVGQTVSEGSVLFLRTA